MARSAKYVIGGRCSSFLFPSVNIRYLLVECIGVHWRNLCILAQLGLDKTGFPAGYLRSKHRQVLKSRTPKKSLANKEFVSWERRIV